MSNSNIATGRSTFVTGLAWTFITLSAFGTAIAILQNIMLALMFPADEMRMAFRDADKSQPVPGIFRFMAENFRYIFLAALLLSASTLVASIGLLKRKNWARLAFIGFMAFGVFWNLVSAVMPFYLRGLIPETSQGQADSFDQQFKLMWQIMTAFTVVMCLVFTGLFVWLIRRLMSADIKREFVAL